MSRFEFNTVLVSIVLAFAISEVLTAWGQLIRHRDHVRSPGLYVLASSWVLAAIVVHWFGLWAYHAAPFDQVLHTILILLPALVIALVCFVWMPDIPASGRFDLEMHYFEVGSWAFPLIGAFILLGAVADVLVPNVAFTPPFAILLVQSLLFVALRFTRHRIAHLTVLCLSWIYIVVSLGVRR